MDSSQAHGPGSEAEPANAGKHNDRQEDGQLSIMSSARVNLRISEPVMGVRT